MKVEICGVFVLKIFTRFKAKILGWRWLLECCWCIHEWIVVVEVKYRYYKVFTVPNLDKETKYCRSSVNLAKSGRKIFTRFEPKILGWRWLLEYCWCIYEWIVVVEVKYRYYKAFTMSTLDKETKYCSKFSEIRKVDFH